MRRGSRGEEKPSPHNFDTYMGRLRLSCLGRKARNLENWGSFTTHLNSAICPVFSHRPKSWGREKFQMKKLTNTYIDTCLSHGTERSPEPKQFGVNKREENEQRTWRCRDPSVGRKIWPRLNSTHFSPAIRERERERGPKWSEDHEGGLMKQYERTR